MRVGMLETWLESGPVRAAMVASSWRETGDTVSLLEEIIRHVDSPSLTLLDEATEKLLGDFYDCTADTDGPPSIDSGVEHVILALLDCGVPPEAVKEAGFSAALVDWTVARTPANWRVLALGMARQGATADQIRVAVPRCVVWRTITTCLAMHGIVLDGVPVWRKGGTFPSPTQGIDMIRFALVPGNTALATALKFNVAVRHVNNQLARYRAGKYPAITAIFQAEAAAA